MATHKRPRPPSPDSSIPLDEAQMPLETGTYSLGSHSYVQYAKRAISVPAADFEALWTLGMDSVSVKPTHFMGRLVRRRQATFGKPYSFSGQQNTVFEVPESEFPVAVRVALEDARVRLEKLVPGAAHERLDGVHVNWYDGGKAQIMPHADSEKELVTGAPIFSYTLLGSADAVPRGFQIYFADGKTLVADVPLFDGDLVVMGGEMQTQFKHGVKPTTSKRLTKHRRINLTVRCFTS